ncbi:hypothetical protein LTS18_011272, partial [Coniosporium uncinatum]
VYALQPAFAQYDRERRGEPPLEQPANAPLPQAPQPPSPTPVKWEAPKTTALLQSNTKISASAREGSINFLKPPEESEPAPHIRSWTNMMTFGYFGQPKQYRGAQMLPPPAPTAPQTQERKDAKPAT